jgi:DNA-binding NarL/FixJ family response regulator
MIRVMNVLIIDDHPLYREGVKALLYGLEPTAQVTGFSTVADACAAGQPQPVNLVLLDMNLPGTSRLEALHAVKATFEDASVVVVSGEEDPALVLSVIDAGAAGYVPKSTEPSVTIQALRLVLAQGIYLPPLALQHAAQRAVQSPTPALSERQTEVLQRLLQGKSNKVIARDLAISEGTVKAHLWAVYQALGVNTRSQAMCKAYELGLLKK